MSKYLVIKRRLDGEADRPATIQLSENITDEELDIMLKEEGVYEVYKFEKDVIVKDKVDENKKG